MSAYLKWLAMVLLLASAHAQAQKLAVDAAQAAKAQGKARVLVMLEDSQDARTGSSHKAREMIAGQVDSILAGLPDGYTVKRRFDLVPAMAIEADLDTLQRLRDDPRVRRIDLDAGGRGSAAPDESTVLNNVDRLTQLLPQGRMVACASCAKIAVLDSGVDSDHAGLNDSTTTPIVQQCFCSNASGSGGCCPNGQATQGGAGSAEDDNGHGTNVSGIIRALGTPGSVASNVPQGAVPGASIVAVKVLDADSSFCCSSDIVAAMDWVAVHHPDVDAVNMSLGTNAVFPGDCDNDNAFTQAMAVAVNNLVAKGAVVTASSGNAGNANNMEAPACVRNAVSVGATWDFTGGGRTFLGCTETGTSPRQPTCFTNRSPTTDLYAAGAFVTSTGTGGGLSTLSSYGGTSQAAPMVAACAAALKEAFPASTPAQRVQAMRESSQRVTDAVSRRSYPFLDCLDARNRMPRSIAVRRAMESGDYDGNGRADLLWRHQVSGNNRIWKGGSSADPLFITNVLSTTWDVAAAADFDGDGKDDLLWRNAQTGANTIWRSASYATQQTVATTSTATFVAGVGDFDGDGRDDLLWRNATTGSNTVFPSGSPATARSLQPVAPAGQVAGIGDFDGNGRSDILWRNTLTGANTIWKAGVHTDTLPVTSVTALDWTVAGVADFDGDGKSDLLWRNLATGANTIWRSANHATQQSVVAVTGLNWRVAAVGDFDGDQRADILWRDGTTGRNTIWRSANHATQLPVSVLADLDWQPKP